MSTSWASATTGLVGGVTFPSDMMAVFFGYREMVFQEESLNREDSESARNVGVKRELEMRGSVLTVVSGNVGGRSSLVCLNRSG